jgi:hypothetical protein
MHVNAVIEVDELGQIVNARPLDGPAGPVALPNRFKFLARGPHFPMTIHANLSRRDVRERRYFDSVMAVPAINAEAARVVFVAECDRLFARNVLHHLVRRADDHSSQPHRDTESDNYGKKAKTHERVSSGREELLHPVLSLVRIAIACLCDRFLNWFEMFCREHIRAVVARNMVPRAQLRRSGFETYK